jgi:UDP-N-acetylmuramyl pentapeptide synthase
MTAGDVRGQIVEEERGQDAGRDRYGADRAECFSVVGRHNAASAVAAAAVGIALGVDLETIGVGLVSFRPACTKSS